MRKLPILILGVLTIGILQGCQERPDADYMAFKNTQYIEQFPKTFHLPAGEQLRLTDSIGVHNLVVQDSLLIVSTLNNDGFWSFYSLPDYRFLGKYITKGNGPGEVLTAPRPGSQQFIKKGGQLQAIIYDPSSGRTYALDISQTLRDNRTAMTELHYDLPPNLFHFTLIDSSTIFCRQVNNELTQQLRFVLNDQGEKHASENMEILNAAQIEPGNDVEILGVFTRYNPEKRMIVEAAFDLNEINLYALDGSFSKTICVGDALDKISDVQKVERKDKMVNYAYLAAYDNYFGALYHHDTNENIYTGKARKQTIQFFDWKGNPLADVTLDHDANCFDIDLNGGYLYTLNYETGAIYKYNIKEIIEYLN